MEAGVFLLLFSCISHIMAIEFIYNDQLEDKINGSNFGTYYVINMHEGIEEPFILGYLEYTSGSTPPVSFTVPDRNANSALGLNLTESTETPGLWQMNIEMLQDYEGSYFSGISRKYYLFVIGTGTDTMSVELNLVNINDNEPIVYVHDSKCEIEENDDQVSTCTYTITDADGYMTGLHLSLSQNYDEVFEFLYVEPVEDDDVKQVNLVLKPIEELDYEEVALYIMEWTVTDTPIVPGDISLSGTGNIVVSVIDMPDTPPVWSEIFAAKEFDELTEQTFNVVAMDGDIGVQDDIFYVTDGEWSNYISIGRSTGEITVLPIDRDADGEIIYTFTVIACEEAMSTECVSQLITFLVRDLNNQIPKITVNSNSIITIPENSYRDLELDISANDMDMGENAMYDITLYSENGQHAAFTVAPSTGYQNSNIFIYIVEFTLLDYDRDEKWREFTLTLNTKDRPDPQNEDEAVFTVILENLNDEVPEFDFGEDNELTAYQATIRETAELGTSIITVKATDEDVGDDVKYSLLGTYISRILTIDEITGEIKTAIEGAFDYETQEEVVLQVQATDIFIDIYNTPLNSAVAQLTITVIDVNDETPRITVGSEPISVPENQEDGTVIVEASSNFLVANDDDQGASLTFIINWDNSYATKTGRRISDEDFEAFKNCIEIDAVSIATTTGKGKAASAVLTIRDVNPGNTPDYEIFDILYIEVIAIDLLQEANSDRATVILPIYILDVNDRPPVFVDSTIESYKSVNEEVATGTTIAIIIANDVDSDEIFYSLKPVNEEHEGLVDINDVGELYVKGRIDADETKLYYMAFTVIASDDDFDTTAEIIIYVNDINDNAPQFTYPADNADFTIPEKSEDGTFITTIEATDADRDDPNNVVGYRFSSSTDSQLSNYFSVGIEDGVFAVFQRDSNNILDRDNQIPGIINTIRVTAFDYGSDDSRSSEVVFTVTLTDINDQKPIIETLNFTTSENTLEGATIGKIEASDADETSTDNSRIEFTIVSIAANEDSKEPPEDDMFVLTDINKDDGTCILTTGVDLETYHGSYAIVIRANDLGEPQQSEEYTITVTIDKFNFYAPTFIYPTPGMTLYLRENQAVNNLLFDYNGEPVPDFRATDGQGDKYRLSFSVLDSEVFTIAGIGVSSAELRLLTTEDLETAYTVTITVAPIDAVNSLTTSMDLLVRFIDIHEEPVFPQLTQTISLLENKTGQTKEFYEAGYSYVPDDLKDIYNVFYVIIGSQQSPFEILDNQVAEIALNVNLDREEQESHVVNIQASRYGGDGSVLELTIELIDVNDNPPHFVQLEYYEKISTTTSIGTEILQVNATDADSTSVLTYHIDNYINIPDIIASTDPFKMDEDSGIITSTVEIPQTGEGHFSFTIKVSDGDYENFASVYIYMVSDAHRVEFVFRNDITTVNSLRYQIRTILEAHFEYNVIIEQVTPNTDDDGNAMEDETIVQVYFVDSDIYEAVAKGAIEDNANDITAFRSLSDRFAEYELNLARFLDNANTTDNTEQMLKAWLIGVSIVLGTLCVLLLVVFILKTRSLTQRLNKLSVIRYGSQDSGLNRKVAPTTNKHAIEGSNPAYSEEKVRSPEDDDAVSVGSGDSDLVGVENNPEFDYNYETNNTNRGPSKGVEVP